MAALNVSELLDRVIDHLHDSPDSLRACALVARAWMPASQFHLHAKRKAVTAYTSHRLIYQLKGSPVARRHLRELSLVISSVAELLVLTHMTPALRRLSIVLCVVDMINIAGSPHAENLPKEKPLIAGGVIRELSLWNCYFGTSTDYVDFLRAFPYLQRLMVSHAFPRTYLATPLSPRISIQDLSLQSGGEEEDVCRLFAGLLDDLSPRILRFLVLDDDETWEGRIRLCEQLGNRSKELHIAVGLPPLCVRQPVPRYFEMPALTKLRIAIEDNRQEGWRVSLPFALQLPPYIYSPQLELVELDFCGLEPAALELDITAKVDWAYVNERFRNMRTGHRPRVHVMIREDWREKMFAQQVRNGLRGLEEEGIVQFIFVSTQQAE